MKEINLPKREIKFRCWFAGKMWQVIRIDFLSGRVYLSEDGQNEDTYSDFTKEDFVLMQYTGLKDKNGKKIYEGDILEYKNTGAWGRFVVKWDKRGFWDCGIDYKNSKIIGNLFENPELLRDN